MDEICLPYASYSDVSSPVVRLRDELRARFRRRIGICRLQDMVFKHGLLVVFTLTVYFVS